MSKIFFLPKNGLFVQAMVFVGSPLQPYKQWDPEAPESDGYAESGADDDGLIHDSNDFEQESEEDEWFDQFIKGASEESIAPTELDPATPKPPAPAVANKDKDKKVPCIRPVARPLCHAGQSGGSDVQMIEDSPVKLEVVVDPDEQVHREKEEKAKKMEALRDELRRLESQMERAAWGTQLFGVSPVKRTCSKRFLLFQRHIFLDWEKVSMRNDLV